MNKYVVEFIGTFFLVLVVALSGNPLAVGAVLVALIYMGGYISGAHYNPAVTLAALIAKKIKAQEAGKYMLTQLFAAVLAAATYYFLTYDRFVVEPSVHFSLASAITAEIVFTFLLASVVLHTAATDKTKGNNYFGLAIGLTVMAGAFAVGPISGGVFNPAVGVGPILYDISNFSFYTNALVTYLIGPFAGGALAGLVYNKLK